MTRTDGSSQLAQTEAHLRSAIASAVDKEAQHLLSSHREMLADFASSGKLVCPLTLLLAAASVDLDYPANEVLDSAIAIELAHRSTLIADDYLDGSDSRNGKPAVHERVDGGFAVLSAGLLGAIAFAIVPSRAAETLSRALSDRAQGQMLERTFRWPPIHTAHARVDRIVRLKSSSFVRAALEIALSPTSDGTLCESMAGNLARAFQTGNDLGEIIPWLDDCSTDTPEDLVNQTPTLALTLAIRRDLIDGHAKKMSWLTKGPRAFMEGARASLMRAYQSGAFRAFINDHVTRAIEQLRASLPQNDDAKQLEDLVTSRWYRAYCDTAVQLAGSERGDERGADHTALGGEVVAVGIPD